MNSYVRGSRRAFGQIARQPVDAQARARERFVAHDHERAIELGIAYLRNRYTHPDQLEWVRSAERTVAAAFAADVALTSIL